jgi:putative transposase
MMQVYRHKATSVSLINYHFVWCPKYRRPVLIGAVKKRLEALLGEVLAKLDCKALALEVMPDHIHLFTSAPPTLAPCQIMFQVKGRLARALRQEFPPLQHWPALWTRSYFVATAGNVSARTIQHYIERQRRGSLAKRS